MSRGAAAGSDGCEERDYGKGQVAFKEREQVRDTLTSEHGREPVFLTDRDVRDFYFGFANRTLWPLFRLFNESVEHDRRTWAAHERVEANKGRATHRWMSEEGVDFMFAAAPDSTWTIKVGLGATEATYSVEDIGDVRMLLRRLTEVD